MNVLVVDIGGTGVKVWRGAETERVRLPADAASTPDGIVKEVRKHLDGWQYDWVSLGLPAEIVNGRPAAEPLGLGKGWIQFDYPHAFEKPVRMMNDAAMQALGSYDNGRMLYLGLGTGLGTTLVHEGKIVPMALGQLEFHQGESFDDHLNSKSLEKRGLKRWRRAVFEAALDLKQAMLADYVTIGGSNAAKLDELPEGCRKALDDSAYLGGAKMWQTDISPNVLEAEAPVAYHLSKYFGTSGVPTH